MEIQSTVCVGPCGKGGNKKSISQSRKYINRSAAPLSGHGYVEILAYHLSRKNKNHKIKSVSRKIDPIALTISGIMLFTARNASEQQHGRLGKMQAKKSVLDSSLRIVV